jgi:hypothetical protein
MVAEIIQTGEEDSENDGERRADSEIDQHHD